MAMPKVDQVDVLPLPDGMRRAPQRSSTFLRLLKYLILLSAAATLSIVLPTPWSYLETERAISRVRIEAANLDPASEWQDNTWPYRPQSSWDISTDFPYPRKVEYEVKEGTWLRLDVHPQSGDVIFDMVGDLYCLPASEIAQGGVTRARPVLRGVPHDSDPHFSPEGDRLVFRSDAELGVENIWVMAWSGCEAMDLTADRTEPELVNALLAREMEDQLLADGVQETEQRKHNRLLREGRHRALRVTNETYRWVSDARFHPSGSKVIATKWYTSSRSLGAGEGWEYSVPSPEDIRSGNQQRISPQTGQRVIGRTLPRGWTPEEYGEQQIGPEQLIWHKDSVIYSKNILDASGFAYSKDVHTGIYSIFQLNLTTKATETLVNAFPGGASRPELSRDGRTLAFVSRVRDKEALVLKDLETGTIHHAWYGLNYDLTTVSAPMGTYPSFAFTPDDGAIIIWAAGQIYNVPLTTNRLGEKVASPAGPYPIRFVAHIEKRLAETLREENDVLGMETQDTQRVYSFKELRVDDHGNRAVFQAAGATYLQEIGRLEAVKVPVLHESSPYYSPAFVHGADHLVLHARWSNADFSSFELADLHSGVAHEVQGLPQGRYFSPVLCECYSSSREIAFIKSGGDLLTGNIVATAKPGLYIASITLPPKGSETSHAITINNLRYVPSEIDPDDRVNMRFLDGNKRLLVQQSNKAFIINFVAGVDEVGRYPHVTLAAGQISKELVVSPHSDWWSRKYSSEHIAFVDFFDVYLASGSSISAEDAVWSKPGNSTKGLTRLSLDGGHDVTFSKDGKKIFWFLGPYLHSIELYKLSKCGSDIARDQLTFGIECVKHLVNSQEVNIKHSTDIARLKKDANGHEIVVIHNATLLTMTTGKQHLDVIKDGVLITEGGIIRSARAANDSEIPHGPATIIDAQGGFIVPGLIDVHAHWSGFGTLYPAASWEMETFLAYGVTTLHNPSADNVAGFVERSRIERGQLIGPRIFTVGDVIYGAGENSIHQDIANLAEARSALLRIKAEGGPASISYKNYNLPSRASRQRLLLEARKLKMLCVPEGGMNYDWDLTYIVDGMTTVEHNLPIPTLYDDVVNLWALSGTGSTPTHIVNYGGVHGEQLVWASEDLPNDPKLRRFHRHDTLQGITESTARPLSSYQLFNTSVSVAKMVEKGLLAHIGAHGEPPLGLNYHAEMYFTQQGGLSNYEVIRAATSSGAKTLGLWSSLGSLSDGKLADYVVYEPTADLLNGDMSESRKIRFVARGGRIWDASTMEEIWPLKGKKQVIPPINADE